MATTSNPIRWDLVDRLLDLALAEDVGDGDATTLALVPADARLTAAFVARGGGVLAGLDALERLLHRFDAEVTLMRLAADGETVAPGKRLAQVAGPARSILTCERTALNLLQSMSGVATLTRAYVEAVAGTNAAIYDTRKTRPGMRVLDKLAVVAGGGRNHRFGLHDMILIKDNHLALLDAPETAAGIVEAVRAARAASTMPVMVEVDTLAQLEAALPVEPDFVLLDNMPPPVLREAVAAADRCRERGLRRPALEASGGVNLHAVRAIAETGVERISAGALTHSAVALDIGLDYENEELA